MIRYEYKVTPAPSKGLKAKGVKGPEARFAHTLEARINELAAEGWQYLRADILPSEERQGLTATQTVYRSVLVFQREVVTQAGQKATPAPPAVQAPTPQPAADTPDPSPDTKSEPDNGPPEKEEKQSG